MKFRILLLLSIACCIAFITACQRKTVPDVAPDVNEDQKREVVAVALAWLGGFSSPTSLEELTAQFQAGSSIETKLRRGELIVREELTQQVVDRMYTPSSHIILVYHKLTPERGGFVAFADASYRQVTAEEFRQMRDAELAAESKGRDLTQNPPGY